MKAINTDNLYLIQKVGSGNSRRETFKNRIKRMNTHLQNNNK